MDPRFRPVSIEIIVTIGIFLFLFQSKIISMDVTNPITLIVLLIMVAEFIRILYKFHVLKKAGVNISEQSYRNPIIDTVNPDVGNTYALINKKRVYLIGIILIIAFIFYYFFHINIINH